ncbi:MAG: patatin-like phospholipase family protein [Schleiferilactobacillus harbinensis]|jgi:NTE family protein|nr:patatin-like phospholipase family protein [Schleiferilactobacillus harbinensis]MCI1911779.1 patatin-like phospholipase family protein [Schleiferilactobacillus harbinensis]
MQAEFKTFFEKPYALVLGGGGAKGAFEIGVAQILWDIHRLPAAIVGSSIGGLNGVLLQGGPNKAWARWQSITAADVFVHPQRPLRDTSPLRQMLIDYVSENPLNIPLWVTVTEIPGGGQVVPVETISDQLTEIIGGGSFFPLLKPQKKRHRWLTDGGMWNDLPVSVAGNLGYRHVLAIYIAGYGPIHPPLPGMQVKRIDTPWELGGFLNFNPVQSRYGYLLGRLTMVRLLAGDTGWYTIVAPNLAEWQRAVSAPGWQALMASRSAWSAALAHWFPELSSGADPSGQITDLFQIYAAQQHINPAKTYIVSTLVDALRAPGQTNTVRIVNRRLRIFRPQRHDPLYQALRILRREFTDGTPK